VRSAASNERTSATMKAVKPKTVPTSARMRRLADGEVCELRAVGERAWNATGAKMNAKPHSAPSHRPIAGISTAARMRSSWDRYALRNISRCVRLPDGTPLDLKKGAAGRWPGDSLLLEAALVYPDGYGTGVDAVDRKIAAFDIAVAGTPAG